jgi:hypothetical protein
MVNIQAPRLTPLVRFIKYMNLSADKYQPEFFLQVVYQLAKSWGRQDYVPQRVAVGAVPTRRRLGHPIARCFEQLHPHPPSPRM